MRAFRGMAPQPQHQHQSTKPLLARLGLLLAAAVAGDLVTKGVMGLLGRLPGLLADNATHALLAGLCWWAVIVGEEGQEQQQQEQRKRVLLELAAATAAGSLLDLDHFWAAHSTALEPALSLPRRPPGHCLTTLLLGGLLAYATLRIARAGACCCLATLCRHRSNNQRSSSSPRNGGGRVCVPPAAAPTRWPLLLLAATLSHQLRDGVRRGLWLCPLANSTPAIPYPLYLCSLAALPLVIRRALRALAPPPSVGGSPKPAYRRVREEDWEAEWGDQDSEDEGEEEGGLEMPVVIV